MQHEFYYKQFPSAHKVCSIPHVTMSEIMPHTSKVPTTHVPLIFLTSRVNRSAVLAKAAYWKCKVDSLILFGLKWQL